MSGEDHFNIPPPPNGDGAIPNPNIPPRQPPPPRKGIDFQMLEAFSEAARVGVRNGVAQIITEPIKMDDNSEETFSLVEMLFDLNAELESLNTNMEKMSELMVIQLQAAGVIEDDDEDEEEERPRKRKKRGARR